MTRTRDFNSIRHGVNARLLTVGREHDSTMHTFTARLVDNGRVGLNGKWLRLKLNETEYEAKQTAGNGETTWTISLSPQDNNNATTYNIAVSFEGDAAKTANAYMTTPNGTSVAACTTIQYSGYKPSANSTSLFITPQTTEGATTLVDRNKMEQDAKDDGWLSVYPEFSLGYPWFRMHAKVHLVVSDLDLRFHVGFSPILPEDGIVEWSDDLVQLFASLTGEVLTEMFIEVGAFIGMYITAKSFSLAGRIPTQQYLIGIALGFITAKFLLQLGLWFRDLNDKVGMLAQGIVNILLALLALFKINIILLFIESVGIGMSMAALSALRWVGSKIGIMFDTVGPVIRSLPDWVDTVEIIGDTLLGITSIIRFMQL